MSSIMNVAKTLLANEEKESATNSKVNRIASSLVNSTAYKEYEISRYNDDSKSFYEGLNALYGEVNGGAYKQSGDFASIIAQNDKMIADTQSALSYFKNKDEKTYSSLQSELNNLTKIRGDLDKLSAEYGKYKDEADFRVNNLYNVPQGSESTVADSIRDIVFKQEPEIYLEDGTEASFGQIIAGQGYKKINAPKSSITEQGMSAISTLLAREGYTTEDFNNISAKIGEVTTGAAANFIGQGLVKLNTTDERMRESLLKYGFTDKEISIYLSNMAYINDSKERKDEFDKMYESINNKIHSEFWTDAILSAASVVGSVAGGVPASGDLIIQNIAAAIDDKLIVDYHTEAQYLSNLSTDIRGKATEHIEKEHGKIASFGYQIGMSIADSALAMVASAGIGAAISGASAASGTMSFAQAAQNAPWVSGVLLGSSAGATTTQSFKAMGYTDSEAFAMGVLAGTAESVFETWSLEKLLGDTINKLSKASLTEVGVKRLLKQTGAILGQALCEGSEELATEVANAMSEVFVLGVGNTTMDAAMQTYMEQGMSYHDAHWKALLDKSVDVLLAFVGGAISGGVMGGGAFTMNSAQQMALKLQYHRDYLKGVTALEKVLDNNVAMSKLRTKLATSFQTTGDKLIDSHINAIVKAGNDENLLRTEYAKVGAEPEVREAALLISIAAQKDTENNETLAADISSVLGVTVTAEDLATNRGGIATIYASYLYFDGLTVSGKKAVIDRAIARTEKFLDEQIKKNKDSVQGRIYYGEVDKSKFDALRKHSVRAIENLANVLDVNVVFFDSSVKGNMKVNGFLDRSTNTVYLDINSGNNAEGVMLFTMAHELVHFMKQESANSYKVLEQFLIDTYGKDKMNTLINEQIAKAKKYGDNMSPEAALEEVICDFAARMLADKKVLTDFARLSNKHKGLAEKIKSFFADSETKLEEMYSKFEADTPEAYELSQLGKGSLEAFRDVFEKSLLDTAVAYRSKKKDGKIGTIDLNAYKEARDEKGDLVFRYQDHKFSRKSTSEDARAAIERVKSGEVVEAPKVKEYEAMTRGQLKKFIADFSKNKSYSNEVAKSVVAAFKDVKYLKPEEIESITDIIWQGLNDFDKIEDRKQFAHEMAEFYATKIIEAQNAMFDDSSDTDTAENYEKYIADIINSVENEILNSYFTKGRQATRSALKDALDVQKERVITTRLLVKLNNKFHYMSRANKADFIYTDLVKQIQSFKLDFGRELTVQEVKPFAERLAAFLQKLSQPSNTEIDVGGKGETTINADAFDPDKSIIDAEALDVISELAGMDDSSERELTVDEYKMFNNVLGLVTKLVSVYGNEYVDGKWQSNLESVTSVIESSEDVYKKNKSIEGVLKSKAKRTFKEQFYTPTDYINFIFGSRESNLINRYVNDIVRAADDMRAEYIKLIRPYEQYLADEKYFNRLYKEEVSICGEKITVGEFISLYCTSKREQAHLGLVGKNTVFGNANEKSTSKLPGRKLRNIMLGNDIKEVKANIQKAYESLNDKDKAFIKLVEEFFNEISTYIKTAADLKYWGYTNAQDESYYFPISREGSGRDIASVYVGAISVVKQSFNHSINKHASGALHIDNVFDVVTKHLDGLMQYKHMFVPVQNFSKLFGKNIAEKGKNAETVLKMLEKNTGSSTVQYIRDWLANVQGKSTAKRDITTFKSFLATSSLGFNLQSVAKQNASLYAMMVEATPEVALSILEQPVFKVLNKDDMTKYSSVASYRIHDNAPYSAAIGKVSSDVIPKTGLEEFGAAFNDKATSFLRWGDQRVTYAMWSACQRIVAHKQGLKLNTVENLVAAGKLLDEMINKYNDTTSNALRPLAVREGGWYSVWSMFASQPIKLWSSATRYANDMKTAKLLGDEAALKDARRGFKKASHAILLQAVWTTLVTAIFAALARKGLPKDEDEITAHVIGVTYVTEVIGVMPIIGDVINVVLEKMAGEYTYDIGGDAMSEYYNNIASLVYTVGQAFQGKGDLAEGRYKKVFELVASLAGVPVRNVYKYSTILTANIDKIVNKTSTYIVDYYYSGYAPTVKDLKNAAKKDSRYAETMLEILASKRMGKKDADSDLTSYTIEELLRLYKAELGKGESGDLNFLLPSSVPSKYTSAETKKYYTVMDKAYGFANNLLGSAKYRTLDDEQRTDAISSVWSIYNDAAKVNATQSAASVPQAARYMIVTSGGEKSTEIYVLANAYEKAYNNATKQERAKMKPIATYFAQLCKEYGVSNEQRVILAAALGIGSTDDIKNAVKKKAESKGITITTSKDE